MRQKAEVDGGELLDRGSRLRVLGCASVSCGVAAALLEVDQRNVAGEGRRPANVNRALPINSAAGQTRSSRNCSRPADRSAAASSICRSNPGLGRSRLSNGTEAGPRIGIQRDPSPALGRLVPVANRRDPRASRSALTSDGAARVGGACLPPGASRGWTAAQARFLKRQLSLPVSMISQ